MLLLFRKLEHVAHLLGSDVKANYHIDPLFDDADPPSFDETDRPSFDDAKLPGFGHANLLDFDEVVAIVLKTAKPIRPCGTGREHQIIMMIGMVLCEVSIRMQLSIRGMHALDVLLEGDGNPPYPDLVFHEVQQAQSNYFNQHTRRLPKASVHIWWLMWRTLLERAQEQPGANFDNDITAMRKMMDQINDSPSSDPLIKLRCRSSQNSVPFGSHVHQARER
jgi:hypothetical protein